MRSIRAFLARTIGTISRTSSSGWKNTPRSEDGLALSRLGRIEAAEMGRTRQTGTVAAFLGPSDGLVCDGARRYARAFSERSSATQRADRDPQPRSGCDRKGQDKEPVSGGTFSIWRQGKELSRIFGVGDVRLCDRSRRSRRLSARAVYEGRAYAAGTGSRKNSSRQTRRARPIGKARFRFRASAAIRIATAASTIT